MSCDNCGKARTRITIEPVNPKELDPIPYIAHDMAMARNYETVKGLVIALIVSICMIVASNFAWLYCWNQYDYSSEESTVEVDANDGIANYIGGVGDIHNEAESGD